MASLLLQHRFEDLFADDIALDVWRDLVVFHRFDRLDLVITNRNAVNWHDLPIRAFLRLIGQAIVIRLTASESRIVLLQVDTGCSVYDPSTAVLLRRLMYLVELKAELMRRLVTELRPATDEASMCAFLEALNSISTAIGLEKEIQDARAELSILQSALFSLRSSSANDRAITSEVRAQLSASGETRTLEEIENEVRTRRALDRAINMSHHVQK